MPWHVSDIFTYTDDTHEYWRGLFESIINTHAPVKRKRVSEQDIPYMIREWKNNLRMRRKFAKMLAKDRTVENLELKRKYQNLATRER